MDTHGRTEPGTTGLVLAGGGARAAYEAGVLLYALDQLPRSTGVEARFDVLSGTSAGALNTCHLAAHARDPAGAARGLASYWRSLTMDKVIRFDGRQLVKAVELLVGRRWEGRSCCGVGCPATPSSTTRQCRALSSSWWATAAVASSRPCCWDAEPIASCSRHAVPC